MSRVETNPPKINDHIVRIHGWDVEVELLSATPNKGAFEVWFAKGIVRECIQRMVAVVYIARFRFYLFHVLDVLV